MSAGERGWPQAPGGLTPGPERGQAGPGDELASERALTAEFREALEAYAEDAREVVRQELARAAPDAHDLERTVRRVARDEFRGWRDEWNRSMRWALVAGASVLALVAAGVGWTVARWSGDPAPAAVLERAEAAPLPDRAVEPAAAAAVDGAAAAARYDSLFAARDSSLLALADRLEPLTGPALSAAANAWRAGSTEQDRLLHDALVQLALREVVDSTVTVDGSVIRTPTCAGQSCSALLAHWAARAGSSGYPELPADPAGDSAGIARVERLLVMELVAGP